MGNLGSAVLSATGGQPAKLGLTNDAALMQAYVGMQGPGGQSRDMCGCVM